MARRFRKPVGQELDASPLARARRLRRRGDQRKAMLILREACNGDDRDARLWTVYGAQCLRAGKRDVARQAYAHALWLRERDRDERRAAVMRELLAGLGHDCAA